VFDWHERVRGQEWLAVKPEGDICPPRVRSSSRNADGVEIYFCYRNGKYLDLAESLDAAKRVVEKGEKNTDRDASVKRIKEYVDKNPLDILPYLSLTQEERTAIRVTYPWAAPAPSKVRAALERPRRAGEAEDPGTARLRAELATEAAVRRGRDVAAKPKRADLQVTMADAKLVRLRDDNPKTPGSAAHKRWETLFAACAEGKTVAAFEAAGGNGETLRNAIAKGYVRAQEEK
jgi:hypothetical protein